MIMVNASTRAPDRVVRQVVASSTSYFFLADSYALDDVESMWCSVYVV
jgi:hypothetical protein